MAHAGPKTATEVGEDTGLPKALVKKIVKNKINQTLAYSAAPDAQEPKKDIQINKDALLAFSESAKVFISYLTSAANDICKEAKRQTISAEDVFTALQDLEFGELISPLKEALEAFRQEAKEKSKRKAEQVKKRKAEEAERLHPHQSTDVTEHIADIATQGPIAGQRFIQQQQQQLQQAGLPPYIVQAQQQGFAPDAPKPAQPAAAQFPKAQQAAPYQPAAAAFPQGTNPFGPNFAQQATQFAAVLAQAQAAQAAQQQQGVSQLLPANFAPAQLQNPTYTQFPASQAAQQAGGGFPAHLGQANYAQFAAVLAQQAARQRAQQQGGPPQQAAPQANLQAQLFQQAAQQQQQQQPVQASNPQSQILHLQQLQQQRIALQQAAAAQAAQQQAQAAHSQGQQPDPLLAVTEAAATQGSGAGSGNPGTGAAFQ